MFLQTPLFLSRWLMAPFLVGLLLGLLLLMYRFFGDLFELAVGLPQANWHDVVTGVLKLVDITLTANLVLIVVFSGYENFIGRIDATAHPQWPEGLVQIDFSALKQKLLGAVVGIAAVDALAWYFDLENTADTSKLSWALAFPLMFGAVLLMLAIADRLGRRGAEK